MSVAAPDDVRDRVGPYRVIAAIGAGGSARIDLARLERAYGFERHVVIKRPLEHLRVDPIVAASLRQEARLGGLLRHPNLVAVLDAGVHDGYDYLVLEYVHGAPLRRVMQTSAADRVRALPLGVALGIAIDIAHGLHHAHELVDGGAALGLVHRDVSPANVLVGLDGAIKLADFGIAKETRVSTLSGSMRGTVTYMAPEQCQGHPFDRRADVFSLGVILFELVTHRRLFHADNDVASLHRVLSGVVPRPRDLRHDLPAELEDIVLSAVAHDPARRFASAGELAAALEAVAARHQLPIGARWTARAIEQVLGRPAEPWRMRAPAVVPPVFAETSLVDVIASLESSEADEERTVVDQPDWWTFGPTDEGEVAADGLAPVAGPAPARRRGRAAVVIAAAAIAAAGVAIAIGIGMSDRDRGAAPVVEATPVTQPEPAPTTPPATQPTPTPGPTTLGGGEPDPAAIELDPETVTTKPTVRHGHRRDDERATTPPIADSGSAAAVVTPPPAVVPAASGSGSGSGSGSSVKTKPETPVWGRDILLPGDRPHAGSGHK